MRMAEKRKLPDISYESKYIDVLGSTLHYLEEGAGDPILFLHGVPTSCYVWRNIIPYLSSLGRCIAPDLIGFGKSGKPDIPYHIHDHIHFIEQFIDKLKLKNITLVMHGFGSVIGFHYAMNHEKNCKGLVFYEGFLRSFNAEDISLPYQEHLVEFDEADVGIEGSGYIDRILPQLVMKQLSDSEMDCYREPFVDKKSAKPIFQYLKELPKGDGKSKLDKLIADYSKKLTKSTLPKLMLYTIPGFITTISTAMWAKDHLPNLEMVEIGEELHLAQESYPDVIGETISAWMQGVEQA